MKNQSTLTNVIRRPVLLVLMLLAAPAAVQAQSGSGDGYDYTINPENTSSITITEYTGPGGAVTIPTKINNRLVTGIGADAFYDCISLTNVMIPASVTSIGTAPFGGDTSLTAITVAPENLFYSSTNGVLFDKRQATLIQYPGGLRGNYTIPTSVTNIAAEAFEYCTSLTSVTIPGSVTSLGGNAFQECTNLTSITIPGSVTSIGDAAFTYCYGLTNAMIANGVTSIGWEAFYLCTRLSRVTIPASLRSIRDGAFQHCTSLTNATIADGVTSIGAGEFSGCSSLTSLTIPNSVTSIGESAFSEQRFGGGLTSVTIPNSVTNIGDYAFYGCLGLTNVTIGNSVTSIGGGAFENCSSLTSVTIPPSVTSIWTYYGPETGGAFESCVSLTNVYFTGDAPGINGPVFDFDSATAYYLPGTTGWSTNFAGLPTALWQPLVQTSDASFGVRTNQFGFNINWASGMSVVVEASTNLVNPVWTPLATNTLPGGTAYFSDPQWTNYPARFYRLRSP